MPPESYIIFFGSTYSANITLHISIRLSSDKSSVYCDDGKFAMIIYYTKIMFIIESEDVCTIYPISFCKAVMMYYHFLQLCLLKCQACSTIFNVGFNVIFYIEPIWHFTCQEFSFFYSHVVDM